MIPQRWKPPDSQGPFMIPSVFDVLSAAAARAAGAERVMLAGSALAAARGLPDLGLLGPDEMARAAFDIVEATGLEVIIDGECGGVSGAVVARLVHRLLEAGVGAMMIEDQSHTGQSTGAKPALCDPDEMCRRITVAKDAGDGDMWVLARTDVLSNDWPIEETLRRLGLYLEAGADAVTAVYVRSPQDIEAVGALAPGRALSINGRGPNGYVPTISDAKAAGMMAHVSGGQERAGMRALINAYRLTLEERLPEMWADGIAPDEFAALLDRRGYLRWLD